MQKRNITHSVKLNPTPSKREEGFQIRTCNKHYIFLIQFTSKISKEKVTSKIGRNIFLNNLLPKTHNLGLSGKL